MSIFRGGGQREKERSLNSSLTVIIVEIYKDQHNTPCIPYWFFKLRVLIRFINGCFRRLCDGGRGEKGMGAVCIDLHSPLNNHCKF